MLIGPDGRLTRCQAQASEAGKWLPVELGITPREDGSKCSVRSFDYLGKQDLLRAVVLRLWVTASLTNLSPKMFTFPFMTVAKL